MWCRTHKFCVRCKTTEHRHRTYGYCHKCLKYCPQRIANNVKYQTSIKGIIVGRKSSRDWRLSNLTRTRPRSNKWQKDNSESTRVTAMLTGRMSDREICVKRDIGILRKFIKILENKK